MVSRKQAKGQSLVELLGGLIVLIPVVLFAVDLGTIFIGAQMNSNICREAARAAASGPPDRIKANQPRERAEAVVQRSMTHNGAVQMNPTVKVTENISTVPQLPFGGPVDGTVTVETSVDVYPPFLIGKIITKPTVNLHTSQTFPYTWVMPGSFSAGAAGGGGAP